MTIPPAEFSGIMPLVLPAMHTYYNTGHQLTFSSVQWKSASVFDIYMVYLYGLLYFFLTTILSIFQGEYQQSVGIAGLRYIALGVGLTGASQLNTKTMDKRTAQMILKILKNVLPHGEQSNMAIGLTIFAQSEL